MAATIPRRRLHRSVFALAGAYNIAWGLYAVVDPQWVFRATGMAPMRHPAVFATLGMVVGLYGVLYLEVARLPERGWPIAAVGHAGKLLGPVGFVGVVLWGHWPPAAAILIVPNDLVWWLPFALYLHDAWPWYRRSLGGGTAPAPER